MSRWDEREIVQTIKEKHCYVRLGADKLTPTTKHRVLLTTGRELSTEHRGSTTCGRQQPRDELVEPTRENGELTNGSKELKDQRTNTTGKRVLKNEQQPSAEREELTNEFELPDGYVVTFDNDELCKCPELLFDPGMLGDGTKTGERSGDRPGDRRLGDRPGDKSGERRLGLDEMVAEALGEDGEDGIMLSTVILTGGSTLFPDLDRRLQEEVNQLLPHTSCVRVLKGGLDLVWRGGARLSTQTDCGWVSGGDWGEEGDRVVMEI